MKEEAIRDLCRQYTELTDREISQLLDMVGILQPMADIEEADIFIDCPMTNGDALVIAEAKPTKVPSSYKNSVVGLFARQENEPAVARTFRLGVGTRQMKATTQEHTITIQTVEPIRNGDRIIGVLIREKRTNEELQLSEKLHLSLEGYEKIASSLSKINPDNNWLTECMDEALLMVDHKGMVIFRNSLAQKLFQQLGYTEEILGQRYVDIGEVRPSRSEQQFFSSEEPDALGEEGTYEEVQVGHTVVSIRHVPLDSQEVAFVVLMRDITLMKRQEKELMLKSVAIREMHHRIKNSLQTVASLLRLQMRRSDSPEVKQVLSESMMRILSIANTHQLLAYDGTDDVWLMEVLRSLKDNALRAYVGTGGQMDIAIEGDNFKVEADVATSVALVVNELLQNALTHAFTDGSDGHIRILVSRGDLYSRIQVSDDGAGFCTDALNEERLGMTIVKTMVKDKLQGGDIEIISGQTGTRVSFQFLNRTMKPAEQAT
ncbi:MAG: histidine kinase N-terminal domain-containing protein [Lachnospiraceae bacterium]|nr:histidine kinase N-terminal domain-containing protein [Lachnospiraceae bacterium]